MPSEIFASYSREDHAQVFPIVDKLRERGLNIWIDQEGIHGAKLWSQEIVNAIDNSKVFILFASAKAFLSKNVTKELALASESDKHILPIFIEDAEIPAAMKYQLAGIQHLVHEQGQNRADSRQYPAHAWQPRHPVCRTPTDALTAICNKACFQDTADLQSP